MKKETGWLKTNAKQYLDSKNKNILLSSICFFVYRHKAQKLPVRLKMGWVGKTFLKIFWAKTKFF